MADETPEIEIPDLEEIEGSDCLVPPTAIRPSEAARITALMESSGDSVSMGDIAPLLELIEEKYLADEAKYQELFAEKGLEGIVNLVAAWTGDLVASKR